MRALVACECSGAIRRRLRARGWDAVSVDLKPAEDEGEGHIVGNVLPYLRRRWDLVIAHPDCTYLANSGVRWLHERADRWPAMFEAADFFLACLSANAPRVAVENPVMHKYARRLIGRAATFTCQPWWFGDDYTKRTCWWLKGLRPLHPTSALDGSTARAAVHLEPPGPERQANRSRTYPGMAEAIVDQWAAADLLTIMEAAE